MSVLARGRLPLRSGWDLPPCPGLVMIGARS
jgi:hypothetical protein